MVYRPVTIMLIGLILRGVSFDYRVKAGDGHKPKWNRAFAAGSLIAAVAQGRMRGSYVTGLSESLLSTAFAGLIELTMPALYIVLGAGWLMIKTEGALFDKAMRWGRNAMPAMGLALLAVSIATPLVSPTIAARWFTLPGFMGLLPIPSTTLIAFVTWILLRPRIAHAGYAWLVMGGTTLICAMATLGLAFSLYPLSLRGYRSPYDVGRCLGDGIAPIRAIRRCHCRTGNHVLHRIRVPNFPRKNDRTKLRTALIGTASPAL